MICSFMKNSEDISKEEDSNSVDTRSAQLNILLHMREKIEHTSMVSTTTARAPAV